MENKNLYTLMPLDEFKALMGVDDRDDKIARFCLVTSTLTIEQYCKRRFLRKKYFENIVYYGDLLLPFKEFPVSKVLAVFFNGEILEPEFFDTVPVCGTDEDIPFYLSLSPALKMYRNLGVIKVIYWGGYPAGKVPADLSAACLELAAWNM